MKEGQVFLKDQAFQGVWRQRGYARMIRVKEDDFTVFDVTDVSCVPSDSGSREDLLEAFERVRGNQDEFSWYEAGAFTRYEFDKVEQLPDSCSRQESDALSNFDALVAYFSENYAFFEEREVDWSKSQKVRDSLNESSDDEQLMEAFQSMLGPLGDGHVYVFDPEGGTGFLGGSLGQLWESWADEFDGDPLGDNPADPRGKFTAAMKDYVLSDVLKGQGQSTLYDMLHWGFVHDDIGYLDVHAMGTYEEEIGIVEADHLVHQAMTQIMGDLSEARAMIIDVRFNEGGYDTVGYAIASWFNDEKRIVSQKRALSKEGWTRLQDIELPAHQGSYTGPVYVLTSKNTISAAETFTLAMRELPHVTVVGTRTYGSLSDSMGRLLPNGWLISLSNEVYQSPSGEIFEAEGVPPDERLTYDSEKSVAQNMDAGLEAVLEFATLR